MLFTHNKSLAVNVQECFDTWSLLNNRFIIINHFRTQANSVHDKDFKYILQKHIHAMEKEAIELEELLDRINTKGPEPATKEVNVMSNPEANKDRDIAKTFYLLYKNEVNKIVRLFRDTVTNDELRGFYLKMAKNTLDRFFDYEDYLKLKGWAETPPLYKYVPPETKEKISTTEVYYLWEHFVFRTTNIHLTNIFLNYVENVDFRKVLEIGVNTLTKQRDRLEKLLLKYGVSLPPKYSNVFPTPEDPTVLEDKFIFLVILQGMQNAASLHGSALVDSLINNEVRTLFKELTFAELNTIHQMDKYGKLKGWTQIVPKYSMNVEE